jgi:hypothetical protein
MFDKETAQFFHLLTSNTIGDASSIGLRSILESNIPANVKTFFRADVEYLRAQEKAKEVRSPKFSYAIPELRLLEEQIDLLLINNYTFSKKDFDATADKCIHFLLNYLCRPEWTLTSFFFDAAVRITAEEMQSKLRYCSDYPYYRAILTKYAETRQRTDVGSEEMKRLLTVIDNEVCGTATPAELAFIAKPIFDFVGAIRSSMRPPLPARVPVRALIYFYEDKRLAQPAAALSAVRELDNGFQLTFPMLEMVLESVAKGTAVPDLSTLSAIETQESVGENTTAPCPPSGSSLEPSFGAQNGDDTLSAIAGPSEEIDELLIEQEFHAPGVTTEVTPEHTPESTIESIPKTTRQLAQDEERSQAAMEEELDDPFIVLPPQFTENDRITITNALFHGSADEFESAVDAAVKAAGWDDAIAALDRFFADRNIDPFAKEAMMFTNILESWHRTLKK